ncbi:transcription elongation factor TFIIS [Impatiens glandulifera]|uniref:transcription elongation factor TFIIS n=1 Tax=Impatiens glandulifera TaxID=253017 RepID=UPI001FB16FDE|nr:transcription elongation factor TFIIS [Impatiens glandulifera]
MERDLLEFFEAAKKSADAAAAEEASSNGPHVDRCRDALKQLKEFPVSYDVLVATQVAKKLRPLTKHPIEEIQTSVSSVLEVWKKIIIDETMRKKNSTTTTTGESTQPKKTVESTQLKKTVVKEVNVKSPSDSSNSRKPAAIISPKAERPNVKAEEKREVSMKKPLHSNAPPKLTSMIKCNDPMRDKMRELILEALVKVSSEVEADRKNQVDQIDPIRVSVMVESAMFEKLGKSNGSQKVKYRSIMFNLKDPKNPDLRRKVLLGEVKPDRLIDMSPEEMASDERQRETKQIKDKALFDCERGLAQAASTDQFKCGRCGQRKTTYYQMQTRSADEPMTTYVTCVNCNNHWKFC